MSAGGVPVEALEATVRVALDEDLAGGDPTSALLGGDAMAVLAARGPGVIGRASCRERV